MPRASRPKVSAPAAGGRTDLATPTQAPTAPTGLPYGEAGKLKAAQAAAPLPGNTPGTAPTPQFAAALAAAAGHNFQPVGLGDPTKRPNEPVTAGLSTGPGPGRDPAMGQAGEPQVMAQLRALYAAHPNEDLRELIEQAERGATF